ncbi:hypothetical protein [Mesorhizobium carmichaelinearum]|uniref:hypothetical protein n=1 Tax=Mesorhizobium carmichaelinearum TaxID=1208188 RepID=UPI0015C82B55|nr:hypothetical protein [Mesorhizobium carmichaelinearum]
MAKADGCCIEGTGVTLKSCGSTASAGAMQIGGHCIGPPLSLVSLRQALQSPFMGVSAILPMPVSAGIIIAPAMRTDMMLAWAADRLNPAARKTASSMTKRCFGESRAIARSG